MKQMMLRGKVEGELWLALRRYGLTREGYIVEGLDIDEMKSEERETS